MISVVQGQELTKRSALADLPASRPYGVLHEGTSAQLCRAGVEDEVLMAERAAELYSTAQSDLSEDEYSRAFGHYYGDYAELIEDLKPESHPYWSDGGETCGASSGQGVNGRRVCELVFGAEGEGQRARGFRILRAFDHELVIEPRFYSNSNERAALLELSNCCFPDASAYIIRASQHWLYREGSSPLHQIGVGSDSVCERDTSPLYEHLNNRIFEVSCDGDDCAGIGPSAAPNTEGSEADAGADWVPACVLSSGGDPPIQPDSVMQNCVFDSLTARFAIYRGQEQSQRGMTFSWRIGGGFLPFSVSLVDINRNSSSTSNPQRLFFNSELQRIVITDGAPPGAGVAPAVTLLGLENRDGSPTITQSRISAF